MKHYAFTYRNVLCCGLIYAALGFIQVANAGFAQVNPPSEFSVANGQHHFRAANANAFINGSAKASGTMNVGGNVIRLPVYARVAANAPEFAARYLFRHPALIVGSAAASIILPAGVEWLNNQWVQQIPNTQNNYPISDGFLWGNFWYPSGQVFNDPRAACNFWANSPSAGAWVPLTGFTCELMLPIQSPSQRTFELNRNGQPFIPSGWTTPWTFSVSHIRQSNCPIGWFATPAGCVQQLQPITRPLTEEEFVPLVAPRINPAQVPQIIPFTVPIPIERPTINPAPRIVPVPYIPPVPRPLIVPLSDPIPIPEISPGHYRQPLVEIIPSPTTQNPWRVSLNPIQRTSTSPSGVQEPTSVIDPDPLAQTRRSEDPSSDFCLRNPNVLACAPVPTLDIPEGEINRITETLTYEPQQFLGGGGSCPRAVTINLAGTQITAFDTPKYCQFIVNYFRPVLLAIAAFTSIMIVAGGFRTM